MRTHKAPYNMIFATFIHRVTGKASIGTFQKGTLPLGATFSSLGSELPSGAFRHVQKLCKEYNKGGFINQYELLSNEEALHKDASDLVAEMWDQQ